MGKCIALKEKLVAEFWVMDFLKEWVDVGSIREKEEVRKREMKSVLVVRKRKKGIGERFSAGGIGCKQEDQMNLMIDIIGSS